MKVEALERGEKESFSWHIFQEKLWAGQNRGKDKHMGWRFTEAELTKRAEAAAATAAALAAKQKAMRRGF